MSAILKFYFQKRKQLRFSEVNYLNYTKKDPMLHVTTTLSLKQGETRTNSVPILHRLSKFLDLRGVLHLLPKISMFCALRVLEIVFVRFCKIL